jgi:hypothetical protein
MDASEFFDTNQKLLGRLGWKPGQKPYFLAMYKDIRPEALEDLKRLCDDAQRAAGGDEAAQARIQGCAGPPASTINPKNSRLAR